MSSHAATKGQAQVRHLIAGTAGHIDHGKTSLVRALTGVDTDRLKEEKLRGITIDLGFASSPLSNDITLSWIDVPGHEKFVGNMLAGVAGIDFVVLVVAATEGVMPQTREHFEICRMLGIRHGIVALTKSDLAEDSAIAIARAEVQALLAGSALEDIPLIPVSSQTGEGVPELREAILVLAQSLESRRPTGNFRLPVDRSFVMKGFGAVVTGTVFDGWIGREMEVDVLPAGLTARVRGIQVHGGSVERATRGQRAALNLAGVSPEQVNRGDALVLPRSFRVARELDVHLEMLASAPELPNLSPVHFHIGTSDCTARLRFHDGVRAAQSGDRLFARVLLDRGVVALPGDHFIIRRFSPVETIGGGIVVDNQPLRLRRKQSVADRLTAMSQPGLGPRVAAVVRGFPFGCEQAELVPRLGAPESEIHDAAQRLGLRNVGTQSPWWIAPEMLEQFAAELQQNLTRFHRENPLLPGAPRETLRSSIGKAAPALLLDWVLRNDARFASEKETVRLATFQPRLSGAQADAAHRIESAFLRAGLSVPSAEEVIASCGVDTPTSRTLLQTLLREGKLVRVSPDLLFHKQALGETVRLLAAHKGKRLSVPEFKQLTGVSRKYAIPLLEFFDRQRITRREGDSRLVL